MTSPSTELQLAIAGRLRAEASADLNREFVRAYQNAWKRAREHLGAAHAAEIEAEVKAHMNRAVAAAQAAHVDPKALAATLAQEIEDEPLY